MIKWCTFSFLLTALCININSSAQSFHKTEAGIKAEINSVETEIRFYSPSIIRVVKAPAGRSFTKESLSVIKQPQKTTFSVKQQGDVLYVKSEKITVALNLKSGEIAYSSGAGELLLKEKEDGVKFTPFNDAGSNTFNVLQSFVLDKDE